jgi:NAD(P)-dependent dehydrogenase (short-subunit alcohol dehydrogenase family)
VFNLDSKHRGFTIGLGRQYAKLLAAEGAKVVVNDLGTARDGTGAGPDVADKVVAEIEETGGAAVASYDSVANAEGAHSIVQTAISSSSGTPE